MKHEKQKQKQQQNQNQNQNQHDSNTDEQQDNNTTHMMMNIPKFSTKEILCGNSKLGNGAFGVVYEIRAIDLQQQHQQQQDHQHQNQQIKDNDDDDDDGDNNNNDTSAAAAAAAVAAHRNFIAEHCIRRRRRPDIISSIDRDDEVLTSSRYAIKRLRSVLIDDQSTIIQGMVDMATETRILCSLPHHPNIIKLRAIGSNHNHNNNNYNNSDAGNSEEYASPYYMFHEDYFLVLDRLYGTLEEKWFHWKKLDRNLKKKQQQKDNHKIILNRLLLPFNKQQQGRRTACKNSQLIITTCQQQQQQQQQQQNENENKQQLLLLLYEERIKVCYDLASAIGHLHEHNIIHRDIKSQNIGFDIRDDLKLFDFGLARELPRTKTHQTNNNGNDNNNNNDELFHMTGFCGSPRYMSPEIGLGEQQKGDQNQNQDKHMYNEKSDVYSYGLLVWEILTLQKPYNGCSIYDLQNIIWPSGGTGGTGGTGVACASAMSSDYDDMVISPDDWAARGNRNRRGCSSISRRSRSRRRNNRKLNNELKPKPRSLIPNPGLASMIERTWSRNIGKRPSMKELEIYIRNEYITFDTSIANDNDNDNGIIESSSLSTSAIVAVTACQQLIEQQRRRRSTFVFGRTQAQQQQPNHRLRRQISSIHSIVSGTIFGGELDDQSSLSCSTTTRSIEEE